MISFDFTSQLEDSFLYSNSIEKQPAFNGTYYSILGNMPDNSYEVIIVETENGLEISLLNEDSNVLQKILFTITKNGVYDDTVIKDYVSKGTPGELEGYFIELTLDNSTKYVMSVNIIENNTENDEIDIAFFNLENELYSKQNLWEGISSTTFIFGLLATFTILGSLVIKKREV
jgi:hypothetical protein